MPRRRPNEPRSASEPGTAFLALALAPGTATTHWAIWLAVALAVAGSSLAMTAFGAARAAQTPPRPQRAFDEARHWLPALNNLDGADVCDAWINVQNLGAESAQAVLITFGEPEGCEACRGPQLSECSGLIAPGRAWSLLGAQIPTGSFGGVLLSISTRSLRTIDEQAPSDDLASAWFCQRVFADVVGRCDAYAELASGWRPGGTLFGLPADGLVGMPLAAMVQRVCPASITPGAVVASTYGVPSDADLGAPLQGDWRSVLPAVHQDRAARQTSVILLQNAGTDCAEAVVELVPDGACEPVAQCVVPAIAPGETVRVRLAACAEEGFHGAARIGSSQPLAVIVDTVLGNGLVSYAAAAETVKPADAAGALPLPDRSRVWAPFVSGHPANEVTVRLALPRGPGSGPVSWRMSVHDADGALAAEQTLQVCAGGVSSAALPAGTLAGHGSLVVEPVGEGAGDVLGVVEQRAWLNRERFEVAEALAEPLMHLPDAGGSADVLALPLILRDLEGAGLSGELAVANLVVLSGQVEAAVAFFDANALVDVVCATLGPLASARFDLNVPPQPIFQGYHGTAVVRAVSWTHDGPPALGASLVIRRGTASDQDVPGDEAGQLSAVRLSSDAAARMAAWGIDDPCGSDIGPLRPPVTPRLPGGIPAPEVRRSGAVLALPILAFLGQDAACDAELTVRNTGSEPSRVLIIEFDEPGFCAPGCFGPRRAACQADLAPGEARSAGVIESELDGSPVGALAVSITTRRLSELGISLPGIEGDPPLADVVCGLAPALVGNCDAFGQLRSALLLEGAWLGIPMDRALGPSIAIDVERTCDVDGMGLLADDRYAALAETGLIAPFDSAGPFGYGVPVAYADGPFHDPELGEGTLAATTLYIQNLGPVCAVPEFWLRAAGECAEVVGCRVYMLAPGETFQLDILDCIPAGWTGSVALRSTVPLAVIAEHQISGPNGQVRLHAFAARPGFDPFDVDLDGAVTPADADRVRAALGTAEGDPGWDERNDLDGDGQVDARDVGLVVSHVCDSAPGGRIFIPYASSPPR